MQKMNIEGTSSVKGVPEAVRDRPTPQNAVFKVASERVRSRASLPPEGTSFAADCNIAWHGKGSVSRGGQDGSGRREPFMECV